MEKCLSFLTVLPSTEKELAEFKRKVKSEIVIHNYPHLVQHQLDFGKRLFDELLADEDLKKFFTAINNLQK
jgi:hypothetical protein